MTDYADLAVVTNLSVHFVSEDSVMQAQVASEPISVTILTFMDLG